MKCWAGILITLACLPMRRPERFSRKNSFFVLPNIKANSGHKQQRHWKRWRAINHVKLNRYEGFFPYPLRCNSNRKRGNSAAPYRKHSNSIKLSRSNDGNGNANLTGDGIPNSHKFSWSRFELKSAVHPYHSLWRLQLMLWNFNSNRVALRMFELFPL